MPRIKNIVQRISATIKTRKFRKGAYFHGLHDRRDRRKANRQKCGVHQPREDASCTALTHPVLTDSEVAELRNKWNSLHTGG